MGFLHKIGFLTEDPEEKKRKAAEAAQKAAEAARAKVGQPTPKFMKKTRDAISQRQKMLDKAMKE